MTPRRRNGMSHVKHVQFFTKVKLKSRAGATATRGFQLHMLLRRTHRDSCEAL
jgi:hypothetical protein